MELTYLIGIVALAIGVALMAAADFGLSMVVAPAYIFHLKLVETLPFFSFGMAEYCLQAVLLVLLGIVLKRFRPIYLFSFVTAVFYGFLLDGCVALLARFDTSGIPARIVCYVLGMLFCAFGVANVFHTYIPPEAYELFVSELAFRFRWSTSVVKTVYDCVSCLVSIILSFAFFGMWHFEGVKLGTVVCALINGFIIGRISGFMDRHFTFYRLMPQRKKNHTEETA